MERKQGRAVPRLSKEELGFAMAAGGAAYEGKMQITISEIFQPIKIDEDIITLNDTPSNRFAGAVLDALKHDREKARAALHRIMLIGFDVLQHSGAAHWKRD